MKYVRSHLSNAEVFRRFIASDDRDRIHLPELLADLGEVDARRLYRPEGYSSMHAYCVGARKWSDDVANKRIRTARTARRFPEIFDALAEGRLHLTGIAMISRRLTRRNGRELIGAIENKTMRQIAEIIAARFPREDLPTRTWVVTPAAMSANSLPAARPVEAPAGAAIDLSGIEF